MDTHSSEMGNIPQEQAPRRKYYGIKFDEYTPQVEGQILRDCLALQKVAEHSFDELVIVCESDKPDNMLKALGLRRVPLTRLTTDWILYRTGEYWPEEPENCETLTRRDLWVQLSKKNLTVMDEQHTNGYYLPPFFFIWGRLAVMLSDKVLNCWKPLRAI